MDLEALYTEYFPKIYNYVFFKIIRKEQTEEIVSTVFLKVVEKIHTYDATKGAFSTWIYRIAQNTMIDYFRTTRETVPIEDRDESDDEWTPDYEAELIKSETRREVYEALSKLDERTREIIALKYFGEMTVRDIAAHLQMNESTVSSIHTRGLKKLRALLGGDYFA